MISLHSTLECTRKCDNTVDFNRKQHICDNEYLIFIASCTLKNAARRNLTHSLLTKGNKNANQCLFYCLNSSVIRGLIQLHIFFLRFSLLLNFYVSWLQFCCTKFYHSICIINILINFYFTPNIIMWATNYYMFSILSFPILFYYSFSWTIFSLLGVLWFAMK